MMATAGVDPELAATIQDGVSVGRFSTTSKPTIDKMLAEEPDFDDESLLRRLEIIRNETPGTAIRTRNFFIPWAVCDKQLAITSASLLIICTTIGVPVLFIEGLLQHDPFFRPGNGLFFSRDENRGYIRLVEKPGIRLVRSLSEDLLAIHIRLVSQIVESFNIEASNLRRLLLQDEFGQSSADPEAKSKILQRITQQLHIAVENFIDLEELTKFLIGASEKVKLAIDPTPAAGTTNEADMLSYLLSKVHHSKRWVSNYRDRANIRINLTFHLSNQTDNNVNLRHAKLARRDTKPNTLIATLARRDSTDMRVITWITLVFLPGTFMATLFSASFFNFQPGNSGSHVSRWIALYFGLTVFLTAAVFVIRSLLFRSKTKLKTDDIDKLLQETSNFVKADDDDEKVELNTNI
ncbi:hypothetical protein L207DRAFT_523115 [Hyaloscypha variabilis F]|uniref:Uncharacterized protein n=1 Tax=Hyaloscypha variabilis (strain UAMH 11265 / GT02V1 / F) TaxID=1149755 RepID=A0A2J6SAF8_HYAVF|nr:hypothetical protein L207DRAFT_523115 [Hyaloscypha variabilis F]